MNSLLKLFTLGSLLIGSVQAEATKPNIVIIYAYDMGASCFCTGNFDATTMYFGTNCING